MYFWFTVALFWETETLHQIIHLIQDIILFFHSQYTSSRTRVRQLITIPASTIKKMPCRWVKEMPNVTWDVFGVGLSRYLACSSRIRPVVCNINILKTRWMKSILSLVQWVLQEVASRNNNFLAYMQLDFCRKFSFRWVINSVLSSLILSLLLIILYSSLFESLNITDFIWRNI